MAFYIGLDCSTQSLSAIALAVTDRAATCVFEDSVVFERDLPAYGTTNGVHRDGLVVTAPPRMWTDALDLMLARLAAQRAFDVRELRAISGAAQQHGTVYLDAAGGFTREASPVWMDESTSPQCREITRTLGGDGHVLALTGSRATERFAGPQIRKFFQESRAGYARTARIHLVSSFLASRLTGSDAPLEPGDAAGMNLMDIERCDWSGDALDATAPELAQRLPRIVPSHTVVGPLARAWQERFGFPAARVIAWTGDNPSSLVGIGLTHRGAVGVSLGTSDTVFGWTERPATSPGGHVFGAPNGGYMTLVCFKNGSLARERVREMYGMTWDQFSDALQRTPAGNNGRMMLPWFEPEITPLVHTAGIHREGLDPAESGANVRAVIEAQMMAMANHWRDVTGAESVGRVIATGGASANRAILQVMADVFGADVHAAPDNAAAIGAALRAWHGDAVADGEALTWDDQLKRVPATAAVRPVPAHVHVYRDLRARYRELESRYAQPGIPRRARP